MILSYEMFRNFVNELNPKNTMSRKNTKSRSRLEIIKYLVRTDVIICDEGHRMKKKTGQLIEAVASVRTSRRIVLTGTPVQNNLDEMYELVKFAKPKSVESLGTLQEFKQRFGRVIEAGQYCDSSKADVVDMNSHSHILNKLLQNTIQRMDSTVLQPYLEQKYDYTIYIKLTEAQRNVYKEIISKTKMIQARKKNFDCFHTLVLICAHMKALKISIDKKKDKENWLKSVPDEDFDDIQNSGKLLLLFEILRNSNALHDKVLVFSQSRNVLDCIEHFLAIDENTWEFELDYFRLDCDTSPKKRTEYCEKFNDLSNERARLFLIGTKAGGVGINLFGANRVIIFDPSWNPSDDVSENIFN